MSNKKPNIENRRDQAAKRLSTRLESLKAKGADDTQIKRDPMVRKIRAEVRKAKMQLANVEKNEKQIAQQAEAKAQKLAAPKTRKLAAPKTDKPKQKKSDEAPPKKKAKKKK